MVSEIIVKEWIDRADQDYEFATINFKNGDKFFNKICFHFHEAAEKYLKTFIVAKELEFRKIHNLPQLLKICKKDDPDFNNLLEECEFLTNFYIETRYPLDWQISNIDYETVEKVKNYTEKIRSFIYRKLNIKK